MTYANISYERDDLGLVVGKRRFRILARLLSDGTPVGRLQRSRLVPAAALDLGGDFDRACEDLVPFFIRLGSPNRVIAYRAAENVLKQAASQRKEIGL